MNAPGSATEEQLLAFAIGGEETVARVRLVLVLMLFAIPLFQIVYQHSHEPELLIGLGAASVALGLGAVFLALSRAPRVALWLPYVTSISDVSLVSAALVAFLVIDAPLTAVNSRVVWEIYLLAIAATALRPRQHVALTTTVVALLQYTAIVAYADWHWELDARAAEQPGYGLFSWPTQVSRLILIGVAGTIAAAIVRFIGRVTHLAGTDALTAAYNRTYFDLRLKQEVQRAQRGGYALSLVLVDIDHFKRINDTFGHETGDRALIHIAQRVKSGLRRSDVLFRHGGDELSVLMPNTTADEAHRILQRVLRSVREQPLDGHALTISAGIAALPPDDADASALVKAADTQLYAAKAGGRDRVMVAVG